MNPLRYLLHCYRRWRLGRWLKHNLRPCGIEDAAALRKSITDNTMKVTTGQTCVDFKYDGPNRNGNTFAPGCFVHRNPGCFPQLRHKDPE